MKIDKIKISENFKEKVRESLGKMIENKKESCRLKDFLKNFIVSTHDTQNDNLFQIYSGEELGFPEIKKVYVFLEL